MVWNVKKQRDEQESLERRGEALKKSLRDMLKYLKLQMFIGMLQQASVPMLVGAGIFVLGYLLGHNAALSNLNIID